MSFLGFKSVVYHGDSCLGELDAIPVNDSKFQFPNNEIRISYISPLSERCAPLSVLQTISSYSVRCKLESSLPAEQQPQLLVLHASCFHELKTAVVVVGDEEIHLVAMPSKQKKFPCFWCYAVPCGLYNASLGMLNPRCLSIVFDLDETLIVANTLKSFEDRIETLKGWISREVDPIRSSGMAAELKRYMDDRALLKQYAECNSVVENGKVYKIEMEEVSYSSSNHDKIVRPVIRLPEKNIVLTRINPEVRDTSVLVKLRPAWEDLRSYLTAKGRKRFEVYVCTMAERDYALEMWRLLDPEANLINSKELLRRVVCVKSGTRKSLLNVFQGGICHPNMAMVIDDRLKVWEDKDQPRVHVVPAFTPYYAPQAETANAVPVLCVARNVACNVRAGFFREFDENFLRKISEQFYEDGVVNLPSPPDVSNYLISEDFVSGPNGNFNIHITEGMHGAEVEQRLHQADEKRGMNSASHPSPNGLEMRTEASLQPVISASNATDLSYQRTLVPQKPSLLGIPAGRDGCPSETNLDINKRLPTIRPAQDMRNPVLGVPPTLKLPGKVSTSNQPRDGWLVEDDSSRGALNSRVSGSIQGYDVLKTEKQRSYQKSSCQSTVQMDQPTDKPRGRNDELGIHGRQKPNLLPSQLSGTSEVVASQNQALVRNEGSPNDAFNANMVPSSLYISVIQEIGRRCGSKVEFRPVMSTSKDLQLSVEVLFGGEKIGAGMGKTRKDAQQQAAESALRSLADTYISYAGPHSTSDDDFDKFSHQNENGFIWDDVDPELSELSTDDKLLKESNSEAAEVACGSNSCKLLNQQAQKRADSPRLQSIPSKRWKGEQPHGSENLSSSRQFKNGHQVL